MIVAKGPASFSSPFTCWTRGLAQERGGPGPNKAGALGGEDLQQRGPGRG
eukprot:CAMPEP_0181462014 /NCGR_PEP_ID=MMETSP1110-20121109/34174_1 /TAXON_ID=174948 /ORGANISM="Symbiodinium sp., Strain CCMP421" /LENGTH=49 /DNA_ID= /DNA_START= /DNA_END= /DNA_ORIENTATION=